MKIINIKLLHALTCIYNHYNIYTYFHSSMGYKKEEKNSNEKKLHTINTPI